MMIEVELSKVLLSAERRPYSKKDYTFTNRPAQEMDYRI